MHRGATWWVSGETQKRKKRHSSDDKESGRALAGCALGCADLGVCMCGLVCMCICVCLYVSACEWESVCVCVCVWYM